MVFGLYGLSFVKHYLPQNDTVVIPDPVCKMYAGTARGKLMPARGPPTPASSGYCRLGQASIAYRCTIRHGLPFRGWQR